jgi:hypothetical protein
MEVREFISEPTGKLSVGRLLMVLIVCVYLGLVCYVGVSTKTIPDIPTGVVGLVALLYGVNKFSSRRDQ